MSWEFVTIERRDRIAIVRFDRSHKANALSVDLIRELTEAAQSFTDDCETSAVVLTGRADQFSLGFDLTDPKVKQMAEAPLYERRARLRYGQRLCQAWESMEPMTIAAIEGWCVGGGAAIVVACDLRVAADNATLYVPERERGMNMGWGSVPRIVNLVGPARAKRIVVMAEKMQADRALDWGLVDWVTKEGGTVDQALEVAERIAAMPPAQVRMCKETINAYATALSAAASSLDRDQFVLAQSSGDYAEGVASFFEKRDPKYTGG